MMGYAEREIFSPSEMLLLMNATRLVRIIHDTTPDDPIRCHELARVIGERLDLPVQDGYYGFVEHTWLWVPRAPLGMWDEVNILDVYVPGSLPQVQLRHFKASLFPPYRWGESRCDIRHDVMEQLQQQLKRVT